MIGKIEPSSTWLSMLFTEPCWKTQTTDTNEQHEYFAKTIIRGLEDDAPGTSHSGKQVWTNASFSVIGIIKELIHAMVGKNMRATIEEWFMLSVGPSARSVLG